jgi:hypothetical protein
VKILGNSAYIKFVEASTTSKATLEDVKASFQRYIEMTTKTGQQLGWDYAGAAFPYTLVEKPEGKDQWFYLKGKDDRLYKYIVVGVGSEFNPETDEEQHFIQVVLPEGATHGDKSKANEFCKFLAKTYKAQLQLFNGRVMYYYPRKP